MVAINNKILELNNSSTCAPMFSIKFWYSPTNVMVVLFGEFKDCCMGDLFGYQSQRILPIFNVQTTIMLSDASGENVKYVMRGSR